MTDPDDRPEDEARHAAQEVHDAACGFARRRGVDLCADEVPADAPADLRAHAAYHRLAVDLGAECG